MIGQLVNSLLPSPKRAVPPPKALPLQAALTALEIEAFDSARVQKYKTELIEQTWKQRLECFWKQGFHDTHHSEDWQDPVYQRQIRSRLGSQWTDADNYRCLRKYGEYPFCICMGWHRMSVSHDSVDIPEYVSRKMRQITEEVPGATFEVDKLQSEQRNYDPFLIVRFRREEYYIECWGDEDLKFPR